MARIFYSNLLLPLALILCPFTVSAQKTVLTIHHFLSPDSVTHKDFITPWAKKIEKESQGRLKFEIFPSMTLGGAPPDLYRQVRDGVVDIVWTLPGYTPGVFPRSEVFELPFIHKDSALTTNLAIQEIYDTHLGEDYRDIHPLLIHVHSGQALHMVDKKITRFADLRGLKLRIPSRSGAWMIDAWQAKPVGMPVPELPQALSRGVIDGGLIPFEIAIPLRVHELTRYSIEGEAGERFGTAVFLFAMNKKRYQALDADLRAIIDQNSDKDFARESGLLWDRVEKKNKEIARSHGNAIVTIDQKELEFFKQAGEITIARWLEETKDHDFDNNALLQAARKAIQRHSR